MTHQNEESPFPGQTSFPVDVGVRQDVHLVLLAFHHFEDLLVFPIFKTLNELERDSFVDNFERLFAVVISLSVRNEERSR